MTTGQHTLGPWIRAGHLICGDRGESVCQLTTRTTTDANTRLIAAAPDLLAALQHLLADARACDMDIGQYSGSLIEARAAIAKATGE